MTNIWNKNEIITPMSEYNLLYQYNKHVNQVQNIKEQPMNVEKPFHKKKLKPSTSKKLLEINHPENTENKILVQKILTINNQPSAYALNDDLPIKPSNLGQKILEMRKLIEDNEGIEKRIKQTNSVKIVCSKFLSFSCKFFLTFLIIFLRIFFILLIYQIYLLYYFQTEEIFSQLKQISKKFLHTIFLIIHIFLYQYKSNFIAKFTLKWKFNIQQHFPKICNFFSLFFQNCSLPQNPSRFNNSLFQKNIRKLAFIRKSIRNNGKMLFQKSAKKIEKKQKSQETELKKNLSKKKRRNVKVQQDFQALLQPQQALEAVLSFITKSIYTTLLLYRFSHNCAFLNGPTQFQKFSSSHHFQQISEARADDDQQMQHLQYKTEKIKILDKSCKKVNKILLFALDDYTQNKSYHQKITTIERLKQCMKKLASNFLAKLQMSLFKKRLKGFLKQYIGYLNCLKKNLILKELKMLGQSISPFQSPIGQQETKSFLLMNPHLAKISKQAENEGQKNNLKQKNIISFQEKKIQQDLQALRDSQVIIQFQVMFMQEFLAFFILGKTIYYSQYSKNQTNCFMKINIIYIQLPYSTKLNFIKYKAKNQPNNYQNRQKFHSVHLLSLR